MKIFQFLLVGTLFFLYSCAQGKQIDSGLAKSIISKHVARFEKPPVRIPVRYSVDAPLLGNGYTGIAISGQPEAQVFRVARNDFWRLKSILDESYPAVLGKIELSIPALQGASYLVEQNLYDATTTARFSKGKQTVYYTAWLSANEDMFFVKVGMTGKGSFKGRAKLVLPGEAEIYVEEPWDRKFPDVGEVKILSNGISCLYRAFEDSVDIRTKAAIALNVKGSDDGTFVVEEGKPVMLTCAFSSNFKSVDCVSEVIKMVADCSLAQIGRLEKRHKEWWEDYWRKSFVSIPDTIVERQYYLSLYGMACCSRDPQFPPSIFGTWITCERPWWNGDYHLNYNHQAPYYALYSANRIEQAKPYYAPLLNQIERGKHYSEKIAGVKDGIMLPVGIGPLSIETTRCPSFMDPRLYSWIEEGNIEEEGMFWKQKSNSAYAVANMSMQFYRTWDVEFARNVYPFAKGVATFWAGYLKYENGSYVIYNDAIHEGSGRSKNPLLSLGLVRMVMQTTIDMSVLLGVDEDLRAKWVDIYANMPGYPLQEKGGNIVFRYTEEGLAWYDGNTLGIQHIYPAGQIGLDSDPELLRISRNTIDMLRRWLDYNGSNSFFPAAVRVGCDPDTIWEKLREYSLHTYGNGFQKGNPHGIENWSTVPNTINEMLCMGHQGVVRVFPIWPKNMDASFRNIRAEGAFLISSTLRNGVVTELAIVSEKGRDLCISNPWPGQKINVMENDIVKEMSGDDRIIIKTKAGANYYFVPVNI